jgi:hypothetical protein
MEKMMERLLAAMNDNLKEMKAGQEHLKEKIMAKLDAHHERMMATMDSR